MRRRNSKSKPPPPPPRQKVEEPVRLVRNLPGPGNKNSQTQRHSIDIPKEHETIQPPPPEKVRPMFQPIVIDPKMLGLGKKRSGEHQKEKQFKLDHPGEITMTPPPPVVVQLPLPEIKTDLKIEMKPSKESETEKPILLPPAPPPTPPGLNPKDKIHPTPKYKITSPPPPPPPPPDKIKILPTEIKSDDKIQPIVSPNKISQDKLLLPEVKARPSSSPMIIDPRPTKRIIVVKIPRHHKSKSPVLPLSPTEPKTQLIKKKKPSKPKPLNPQKVQGMTKSQAAHDIGEQRKLLEELDKADKAQHEIERKALNKLRKFRIPHQELLLHDLLHEDLEFCDFDGYMRLYFSPMLRSYALQNWKHLYRGGMVHSKWKMGVNMSEIGTKPEELSEQLQIKYEEKLKFLEPLKEVALDDFHYEFLKELSINQIITIPMTIMHGMLQEVLPYTEALYHCYWKLSGPHHGFTYHAAHSFARIKNRLQMYDNM